MVCHLITILLNICSARTWNRFQNIKKWRAPLTLPFSKGHEFKLISFYKATDHFLHKSHHQFPVRIPNQNPSGFQTTPRPKKSQWAPQTFRSTPNRSAPGIPGQTQLLGGVPRWSQNSLGHPCGAKRLELPSDHRSFPVDQGRADMV